MSGNKSEKTGYEGRLVFGAGGGFFVLAAIVLIAGTIGAVFLSRREKSGARTDKIAGETTAAWETAAGSGVFEEGTYVLGVDIGGLDEASALKKLTGAALKAESEYECTLRYGEKVFVLTGEDVDLTIDIASALKAARGGAGRYEAKVTPVKGARLKGEVDEIANEIDSEGEPGRLIGAYDADEGDSVIESNGRFALTAAKDGSRLNRERTMELILSGETSIALPVESVPADGADEKLPVLRARFSTSFASAGLSAANRVANIKKAAAIINGSVLEPGERLSLNALLGERTEESGWLPATSFANGGTETELAAGGGICQVSTTLYNCALLAGLDIPERHAHSRRVSYIEGGRDASLNYGTADLVIANSTLSRVHIFIWADEANAQVGCEIYGEAFGADHDEIRLSSELTETLEPGESEFTADPKLAPGECVLIRSARAGSVYQTYRIYLKNGKELRREKVAETTYLMHPALYAVGAEEGGGD